MRKELAPVLDRDGGEVIAPDIDRILGSHGSLKSIRSGKDVVIK